MKDLIGGILLISLAGFFLYWTIDPFHKPKFKEGDCVAYVFSKTEFLPKELSKFPDKVLKVGKEDYFLKESGGTLSSRNIKIVDDQDEKVECHCTDNVCTLDNK